MASWYKHKFWKSFCFTDCLRDDHDSADVCETFSTFVLVKCFLIPPFCWLFIALHTINILSEINRIPLCANRIQKLIETLPRNSAPCRDNTLTKPVKLIKYICSIFLCSIFSPSLDTRKTRAHWKLAKVTAVFKSGKIKELIKYSPISLKWILHINRTSDTFKFNDPLVCNDSIFVYQNGFRRLHCRENQLLFNLSPIYIATFTPELKPVQFLLTLKMHSVGYLTNGSFLNYAFTKQTPSNWVDFLFSLQQLTKYSL